ncbi:MAG TPA: serine/threonine-protein kinase, partial [Acidimicrobiales bacterium]|nr:serine/threonine-protein kinase [Acidimicrobiales bacterium]
MAGDALLGREMGRYRIESIIGSGGFATVYRAIDLALERPIALKVVDPTAHRNPTVGRRFVLEGRAVASLDHPAVVPVYDAGENDGVLWMAMRLIPGGSLDDALVAGRRFTFDQVAAVIARIGDALDHAHGHGIVHRDVKPSNILLEQNDPGRAWLADFGIAATTRTAGRYTTGALGTAAYMAPEQARPSSVGPPADLYSLGCVAYELLTRRRPFPGDDYVELLVAHATHPVPPTPWPRVDGFMQRALAKDPATRPASGAAFATELRRALHEADQARRPPAPPEAPAAPAPSRPAAAPLPPPPPSPSPGADRPAEASQAAAAPAGHQPPPPHRPGDPV